MNMLSSERLIDRYMESYDMRTSHQIEVSAPAGPTYEAARELDMSRSVPTMALFAIRGLPHVLTGKARLTSSVTLETFLDLGFVILEEQAPSEFVMGLVGKFWRPDGALLRIAPGEFLGFDEPGYAKGILSFEVQELGLDHCRLTTETRVACTDAASRRKFSLYWRAIGPFSAWIRQMMLAEIKRAAEGARGREVAGSP